MRLTGAHEHHITVGAYFLSNSQAQKTQNAYL